MSFATVEVCEDLALLVYQVSEIFPVFRAGHGNDPFRSAAGSREASSRLSSV
jgi:hypothetical protein